MRIMFIHADGMEYTLTQATKFAEPVTDTAGDIPKVGQFGDVLVAFVTVESGDAASSEIVAKKAAEESLSVAGMVKAVSILIYPYAHLSSDLAKPKEAVHVLELMHNELKKAACPSGISVSRAPFGWYKSFSMRCRGHPLSELSRQINADDEHVTREDIVEGITSECLILSPDGRETKIEMNADAINRMEEIPDSMKKFIISEELKRATGREPPSIKAMQRLELVDYEPASDSGNFRLYPKGTLVFNLIRDWADYIAHEKLGAVEIDTPILYDWAQPDINAQAKSFHQRHYRVRSGAENREFVLRFAGDFGLFRIMRDATISYKHLPVRVYEFSKSFRYEQRGELLGLKRLRAFHMPDIHTFAADIEQGWDEFRALYAVFNAEMERSGIEHINAFRVVREFYIHHKEKIVELLSKSRKPAYVEILSEAKHYWVIKNETHGIDSTGRAFQLSTVQLDIEDAERYGITFTDRDGTKKGCIITHSSIGSVERWIYGFLEQALKSAKPSLPFWLAPVQVRFIPLKAEFIEDCVRLAETIGARADVDDREEKVSRKIRDAESEWINMIIVYGEKEKSSGKLPVRLRDGTLIELTVDEISGRIKNELRGWPYRRIPVPVLLSRNVVYRG